MKQIEIIKDITVFDCKISGPKNTSESTRIHKYNEWVVTLTYYSGRTGETVQFPIKCKEFGVNADEFIDEAQRLNKN